MTPLSYHSSNLPLIVLEIMRLLVQINVYKLFQENSETYDAAFFFKLFFYFKLFIIKQVSFITQKSNLNHNQGHLNLFHHHKICHSAQYDLVQFSRHSSFHFLYQYVSANFEACSIFTVLSQRTVLMYLSIFF